MTTENALDPPPASRRTGKAPYPRLAATIVGVVIVAAVIAVILHFTLGHSDQQSQATRAGFDRGAANAPIQAPPAVTAQTAEQTQANLAAAQRAAEAPQLAVTPAQVSTVSPPVGATPQGDGVTASSRSVGSADG